MTPLGEMVWMYVNPISENGPLAQGEPGLFNAVFRGHRYGPDYPAFEGKDLTPGDPLELYNRPIPVPDGEGATEPMTASRDDRRGGLDPGGLGCDFLHGDQLQPDLRISCGSVHPHGRRGRVRDRRRGSHDWLDAPAGDLFFVIVGVDDTGVYESSWGTAGSGEQRGGTSASWMCGVTTKDATEGCP